MIKPQQNSPVSKKLQVAKMFDNIAKSYDFLNHSLSFGMDFYWRKKAVSKLTNNPKKILDVATGTGDLAIELSKLNADQIVGIDIANEMINIGRKKIVSKGLEKVIELQEGDAENLKFPDNSFDAITVAFGVRNFENLNSGLKEMCRVLRPGGIVAVLEFSKPKAFPIKQLYNFYFRNILPIMGRTVSKSNAAYTYLPDSVRSFAEDDVFLAELGQAGFKETKQNRLTMGIATLYYATK